MYLPRRKRALTGREMAELQEAGVARKRRKALCNAEIRLKTMLNSNSMLQRPFSVKMMSFGFFQVQRFLKI
jgi:hypothetical protein